MIYTTISAKKFVEIVLEKIIQDGDKSPAVAIGDLKTPQANTIIEMTKRINSGYIELRLNRIKSTQRLTTKWNEIQTESKLATNGVVVIYGICSASADIRDGLYKLTEDQMKSSTRTLPNGWIVIINETEDGFDKLAIKERSRLNRIGVTKISLDTDYIRTNYNIVKVILLSSGPISCTGMIVQGPRGGYYYLDEMCTKFAVMRALRVGILPCGITVTMLKISSKLNNAVVVSSEQDEKQILKQFNNLTKLTGIKGAEKALEIGASLWLETKS